MVCGRLIEAAWHHPYEAKTPEGAEEALLVDPAVVSCILLQCTGECVALSI
jgi:hypothetical protein